MMKIQTTRAIGRESIGKRTLPTGAVFDALSSNAPEIDGQPAWCDILTDSGLFRIYSTEWGSPVRRFPAWGLTLMILIAMLI